MTRSDGNTLDGSRSTAGLIVVGIALVVIFGFVALRPGATEIQVFPEVPLGDPGDLQPSGAPIAVVTGKKQSEGTSILGMKFGRETYLVSVHFYTSRGCLPLIDFGDSWPAPFVECKADLIIEGEVSGLGNAPSGETMVVVDVDVGRDCFDAVSRGSFWPPDVPACIEDG